MKKFAGFVLLAVVFAAAPTRTLAQTAVADSSGAASVESPSPAASATSDASAGPDESFAKALGGDFRRFFARDNLRVGLLFGAAALATTRWDGSAAEEFRESPSWLFRGGNTAGALWMQGSGALATMAAGTLMHQPQTTALGSELLRAQLVSQAFVQSLKIASERTRPDASNHWSFPSGHAASAFATASVLDRRFGWKVGLPAYALGGYVAASRLTSSKHYLSDVVVGAAIGVAAGRAATVGVGRLHFDLGVSPTPGGAALTFTKKN